MWGLTDSELASETEETKRDILTEAVNKKLGPTLYNIGIKSYLGDFFDDTDTASFNPYVENEVIEELTMPEADTIADYNRYIESEVLPRNGKKMSSAKVVSRVKHKDGKMKGTYNKNTILDTRVYNGMFTDGAVYQYEANIIAENMYS